jgi:TonB family protein
MGKNRWFIVFAALAAVSAPVISMNSHPESAKACSGAASLQESAKPDEKTGVVELGEVKPPKLIKAVTPKYPAEALRLGIEGTVIVEATTDLEGRVESIKILKPMPPLDQAAVKAIKKWRYDPYMINGRPRRVVFTVTVGFSLHGGKTNDALAAVGPPVRLKRVDPIYPEEAKKAGIEGTVVLGATIDGEGKITDVKVLESVPGLDQAAVDALKQWLYAPVRVGGQPITYSFTVSVRFALKPGKN